MRKWNIVVLALATLTAVCCGCAGTSWQERSTTESKSVPTIEGKDQFNGTTPKSYVEFLVAHGQRTVISVPKEANEEFIAGATAYGQSRFVDAEKHYRHAYKIVERKFGPNHPVTGVSAVSLGDALVEQHKYAEGEQLLRRGLEVFESRPAMDEIDRVYVGRIAARIGLSLYGQGKFAEAETFLSRGLEILNPMFVDEAVVAFNIYLGEALYCQGKYSDAEGVFRYALEMNEKLCGPEDYETARSVRGLALATFCQKRYTEAEPLLRRALGLYEKNRNIGPCHKGTIELKRSLDICLENIER